MKVLLLNPPFLKGFVRISRCFWLPISGSLWYPIFLAYCAGWLEKHGHKIKLVDAIAENLSHQRTLEVAKGYKSELLVLYTSSPSFQNDIELGEKIKKVTGCLLTLVGPVCAPDPVALMENHPAIDFLVEREFDNPVLAIAQGTAPHEIKGLTWRKKDQVISNPGLNFVEEKQLDEFPFVTKIYKEHLPVKNYYQASLLHPFVDLLTARGCAWGKCTFCLWPQTFHRGAGYRQRSLANVVEELKYIHRFLPEVREVFFQDDMLPNGRAATLSQSILENDLKITWSGYAKANLPLTTLKLMKRAGCRFLHVGFESADPQILKNIHKGVTVEQMEEFIANAQKAGVQIHGDFIIGLPGESKHTIRKTIEWAKDQDIDAYQFSIPEANPTTEIYRQLKSKNYLTSQNQPSYPHLTLADLSSWRFRAMRDLHLRPSYLLKVIKGLKNPREFIRLARTAYYLIPNLLLSRIRQ